MRTLTLLLITLAACKGSVENKRVDKLDYKTFTVAVPAGWNEVTDSRLTGKMAAGAHTVMMDPPPKDAFAPSIYIQELEMTPSDHQQVSTATDDQCKDVFLKAVAQATKAEPISAKAVEFHGLKGCEVNVQDPKSAQAARQFAISNGKVAVSVTCNHDKKGQPEADAGCVAIMNGITVK
jgi:hypothetical protein